MKLKYTVVEVNLPSYDTGYVGDIKDFTDPVEAIKHRDKLESTNDDPDTFYAVEVNTIEEKPNAD